MDTVDMDIVVMDIMVIDMDMVDTDIVVPGNRSIGPAIAPAKCTWSRFKWPNKSN